MSTTDVITIDALKLFEKVVFCEAFLCSRRKYRGTSMFKTVSKPLAHLNFLSGVNCYDIGSNSSLKYLGEGIECVLCAYCTMAPGLWCRIIPPQAKDVM